MPDIKKKTFGHLWISQIIFILTLIGLIALVAGKLGWDQTLRIKSGVDRETYTSLFINLFFIAVLVERFIEVFNSIWRGKKKQEHVRAVENAGSDKERIGALRKLDAYRSQTEMLAMSGGFAIGIVIGFAGVHTLQTIFDAESIVGAQKSLFQAMDILLTAGLIAGGSKGINALTSMFGSILVATRERAEFRKPGKR